MSLDKIKRRDFLKIMGWGGVGATLAGCDMPTTVTLEEGKEDVVSYLIPEEYVIPGVGLWYASTCQQCSAACGLHGRVREGRVLKLEGNPESAINNGKLCQMGQAGLQGHYNPDRITKPMARKGGSLVEVSWQEAYDLLEQKTSGVPGERFAWLTGSISGHQAVMVDAHLDAMASSNHFVHEVINNSVWQAVCEDTLGDPNPSLDMDKAKVILSFGADFLGTWVSPVHFSGEYAKFRMAPRGTLIQVEPKMSLTGGNADLWISNRPGTEGVIALGIANVLATKHRQDISMLPAQTQQLIRSYSLDNVTKNTGVSGDHIIRTAALLRERSPSLVLAGATAEGHEQGYGSVAAAMMLNIILGNIGNTIASSGSFPFTQMQAKSGSGKDLLAFAKKADEQALDAVFIYGTNPAYSAPDALSIKDNLKKIPFKVAFTQFEDETTLLADLVLPLASTYEDWGTHVAAYQGKQAVISIQQPLMEPVYKDTRGLGDIVLSLLKKKQSNIYGNFKDYYAYLQNAVSSLPASLRTEVQTDEEFWTSTRQKGVLNVNTTKRNTTVKPVDFTVSEYSESNEFPYHLVPSARLGLWDGRHANLPWLQEAPDQISKVVWDSWAEIHPKTAAKLGVQQGDTLKISSSQGAIEAKVYIYKGIHPDAVAVPMGQGHEAYGRYAKDRGVNPLKILNPLTDQKTGELALQATRVNVTKAATTGKLVRFGGSEVQLGRKIVATVTTDVFDRTEGGA